MTSHPISLLGKGPEERVLHGRLDQRLGCRTKDTNSGVSVQPPALFTDPVLPFGNMASGRVDGASADAQIDLSLFYALPVVQGFFPGT